MSKSCFLLGNCTKPVFILSTIFFFLVITPERGISQTATNYSFSKTNNNTYTAISGTSLLGTGQDDISSAVTNIGFSFVFGGVTYTQFSVSSNGVLGLGASKVYSGSNNSISNISTTSYPLITAAWDDFTTGSNGGVSYIVSGTSPNRILTVQWKVNNWSDYSSSPKTKAITKNFQIKLAESTNVIQLIYGPGANFPANDGGSSVGIASNAYHFQSVTTSNTFNSNTVNTVDYNDENTKWPGSTSGGTIFTFAPPSSPLTINSVTKKSYNGSDMSCYGVNDAQVTVNATGGTGNLTYSMNGGTYQASNIFNNLGNGHYSFKAKDQSGNISNIKEIDINAPVQLRITRLFNTGGNYGGSPSCFGSSDGSFGIDVDGGTGNVLASKDNGATYQSAYYFDKLSAGTYAVKIKDVNGCIATGSYTVTGPDPVSATFNQTNFSCTSSKGTVVITPSGGAGSGYYYNVDNGPTTWSTTFNNLSEGIHNVKVTDYRGCTSTVPVTLSKNYTANISGTSVICTGSTTTFNVKISSGISNNFSVVYKDNSGKQYTASNLVSGDNTVITGLVSGNQSFSLVSVTSQNGCTASVSGTANVSTTDPGTWLGNNNNWNDGNNWSCGALPTLATSVTIPASQNNPVIPSGISSVKNITIASGAALTVNGTFQIAGTISNNGTLDVTNGTVEMKGSALQTISGSWFVNRTIRNLKISNTAGVNLSETANDTLNITGVLSFGVSNATFNTKDNLTLKSTAAGTASVADLTNNGANKGNAILGNVVVERYINTGSLPGQHNKCWVMISTPTQGQTIKQSWMENGDKTSTGYGTQISGNGVGFDLASGTPALKYYNDVTGAWVGVTNTNDQVYNNKGYMLFVRGDRSAVFPNYNNTTLRTKGTLLTGTMPAITVKAGKFQSVGNPYAAEVDIRKITTTGISPDIIVWDATLTTGSAYGLGAYQTLYKMGSNYYNLLSSPAYGPAGTVNNYIKSGLAFFVQTFDADGQLIFTENSKSSQAGVGIALRGGSPDDKSISIATNLFGLRADGSAFITDGTVQEFSDEYSNAVDNMDSRKIANSTENLSIRTGGQDLIIERRNKITSGDTIYYNLTGLVNQNYRFELDATGLLEAGVQGFVEDHYTNTQTPLNPEGTTTVDFTVTSAAGSRMANRFSIVFKTASVLPVTIASVKAVQKNSNIAVEWKVENQSKMQQYEIERSADGNQFTKVASVAANNSDAATYNWLDEHAASGYNYYRIRSIDVNGQASYSQVVKVQMSALASSVSVYPNPAINATVHVQLSNQPAGIYYARLINPIGQVILSKQINHKEGSSAEVIKWNSNSARGTYHLEIAKPGGDSETITILY